MTQKRSSVVAVTWDALRKNVYVRRARRGYRYLYLWYNGKRLSLSRYLYARYVRPLCPDEVVHHRDGNSFNCSLANLYACSQSLHNLIHDAWDCLALLHDRDYV